MSEKLSNASLSRIRDSLMSNMGDAACPFCGRREWTVDDELSSLLALQSTSPRVQLDRGYSMVLVTCDGCGFTAPFAAKKLGIG